MNLAESKFHQGAQTLNPSDVAAHNGDAVTGAECGAYSCFSGWKPPGDLHPFPTEILFMEAFIGLEEMWNYHGVSFYKLPLFFSVNCGMLHIALKEDVSNKKKSRIWRKK